MDPSISPTANNRFARCQRAPKAYSEKQPLGMHRPGKIGGKALLIKLVRAICVQKDTTNRYLFELLRKIEEGARRLASAITSSGETRVHHITLVNVELEEITNALEAFKSEVAAGANVGCIGDRMIKE